MIPVSIARVVLLTMGVLALLTATVLDGFMMRYFMHPLLRLGERATGGASRPPKALAFLLERAWARRVYHMAFAVLLLAGWWYLGTESGAARWVAMLTPPPR